MKSRVLAWVMNSGDILRAFIDDFSSSFRTKRTHLSLGRSNCELHAIPLENANISIVIFNTDSLDYISHDKYNIPIRSADSSGSNNKFVATRYRHKLHSPMGSALPYHVSFEHMTRPDHVTGVPGEPVRSLGQKIRILSAYTYYRLPRRAHFSAVETSSTCYECIASPLRTAWVVRACIYKYVCATTTTTTTTTTDRPTDRPRSRSHCWPRAADGESRRGLHFLVRFVSYTIFSKRFRTTVERVVVVRTVFRLGVRVVIIIIFLPYYMSYIFFVQYVAATAASYTYTGDQLAGEMNMFSAAAGALCARVMNVIYTHHENSVHSSTTRVCIYDIIITVTAADRSWWKQCARARGRIVLISPLSENLPEL